MAVKITDICINCGACIDECPVEAIVDEDENPTGEETYYVFSTAAECEANGKSASNVCVECVGHHDVPACATACPTEGCIVWDEQKQSPSNSNRGKVGEPCVTA